MSQYKILKRHVEMHCQDYKYHWLHFIKFNRASFTMFQTVFGAVLKAISLTRTFLFYLNHYVSILYGNTEVIGDIHKKARVYEDFPPACLLTLLVELEHFPVVFPFRVVVIPFASR